MPSARSRFASAAPTPGSVSIPIAATRCGATQPRGRSHSRWTTPVKPGCTRVIVATGTEHRTRSGRNGDDSLVVEPEEPHRPRACVRADNGPERRGDLDLRVRPLVL